MEIPYLSKITQSLSGRFIAWFLFVALVPLTLVSVVSFLQAENSLEASSQQSVEILAEATEEELINFFVEEEQKWRLWNVVWRLHTA